MVDQKSTSLAHRLEIDADVVPDIGRDDLPRRRAVIERGRLRRWRRWSGEYAVPLVSVGATVATGHNVATIYRRGPVRAIDVAGALGVAPDQIAKILTKQIGEQVLEGDLLAEQRLFLGGRKRRIFSPASGQLLYASPHSGCAYISGPPTEAMVLAYLGGQVVHIADDGVFVEGNASTVGGVAGAGRAVTGRLVVAKTPREIPTELNGSIVACGFTIDETTTRLVSTRGAVGLVAAGIDPAAITRLGWDDVLWPLVRMRFGSPGFHPAPPITVMLLSLSDEPVAPQVWARVASSASRPVSLIGYEPGSPPELLVMLDGPSGGMPAPVTVGSMTAARVRSGTGIGRVVKVDGILPFPVQLPSEYEVQAARLNEGGDSLVGGTQPVVPMRHLQSLIAEP